MSLQILLYSLEPTYLIKPTLTKKKLYIYNKMKQQKKKKEEKKQHNNNNNNILRPRWTMT